MMAVVRSGATAFVLASALFAMVLPPAGAGSGAAPADRFSLAEAADFSKQIEQDLAARGARLAIVFRSGRGRDGLPDGIRYTHGAFWVYHPIQTEAGDTLFGYGVYNLYHGEENQLISNLVQDWPLDFARGDVIGEVGIIIPSPEMQRRILGVMASPAYHRLHNPNYSLVSNPHDSRFQNCNEFMLRVVASAAWQSNDPDILQSAINAHFEPTRVRTGLLTRMFGPSVDDRLRIDDHNGPIRTTTFSSLAEFMQRNGLTQSVYELEADHLTAG